MRMEPKCTQLRGNPDTDSSGQTKMRHIDTAASSNVKGVGEPPVLSRSRRSTTAPASMRRHPLRRERGAKFSN
eukprot:2884122-Pyramimonas_sp.AAC.1